MEASVLAEMVKQAPAVGAVLAVGYFIFKAYQKLVEKLMALIEASTSAVTANTAVLQSLVVTIDAIPGKVAHELRGPEHARLLQQTLEQRRGA